MSSIATPLEKLPIAYREAFVDEKALYLSDLALGLAIVHRSLRVNLLRLDEVKCLPEGLDTSKLANDLEAHTSETDEPTEIVLDEVKIFYKNRRNVVINFEPPQLLVDERNIILDTVRNSAGLDTLPDKFDGFRWGLHVGNTPSNTGIDASEIYQTLYSALPTTLTLDALIIET